MRRDGTSFWANWWRILLFPLVIPAILALLVYWLFPGSTKSRKRTPQEVAKILRGFISGTGGEWDWDDFTSTPIADPELEAIRAEAEMVALPADDAGIAKLRELLERVNSLSR